MVQALAEQAARGETDSGEQPPPRRGRRVVGLLLTVVVVCALLAGVGVGYALRPQLHSGKPSTSSGLNAAAIASRVDPALVDVKVTDGDEGIVAEATGMVLSASGVVLTNNHVIDGATSIQATDVGNHRTYPARVVGYDLAGDTAVLQLQGASGLATVVIGNSSAVRVGARVVAIGNAGGTGGTPSVATGSVTALQQSIVAVNDVTSATEQLSGLIETNSPIQPGDSGGPLVTAAGDVIGMDTAASSSYSFSGESTQGYAIPIATARGIAQQIRKGEASARVHIGPTAFLGVAVATYSEGFRPGAAGATEVVVLGVVGGTAAERLGIVAGDVITSLEGKSVSTASQLTTLMQQQHPGASVRIGWMDVSGGSHTASAVLGTGPAG
ncbi:MAG TPA: trypsin-like peptidase domain-containing protein [Acidimicrobiales bacterium]|nr:trypsin-like peptidase domain-containing protein [Acidimicrobiales bacterium]